MKKERKKESGLVIARWLGEREIENNYLKNTEFSFGVIKNILELDKGVVLKQCEYSKCHLIIHLKRLIL